MKNKHLTNFNSLHWIKSDKILFIAKDYYEILKSQHLDKLHTIVAFVNGKVMRQVSSRCTLEICIPYQDKNYVFYLKKFYQTHNKDNPIIQAYTEFNNLLELKALGIPVPSPVLVGGTDSQKVGILATEKIYNAIQSDYLLTKNNDKIQISSNTRKKLIVKIADLAAKFHKLGWVHRDMYLCHFFSKISHPEKIDLYIIDLQRAFTPNKALFFRYQIKDLAAIKYSASQCNLTNNEMTLLFNNYFQFMNINNYLKSIFNFLIKLKAKKIARHDRNIILKKI